MDKKILSNFLYQSSYQLLLIIMPIITIPITSKALGVEGIGVYQYIYSIVGYFVLLAGLGMQNYGVREIAIASGNKKNISRKFWELFFLNFLVSLIVLLGYLTMIYFSSNEYQIYFLIQLTVILSSFIDISWFFGGLEDFKTIAIRNFMIKTITFIFIVVFINNKDDLIRYFIIMGTSTLLSQLSLWIALKNRIVWIGVSVRDVFSHFKSSMTFFIAKIAFQFYYNVSITLLGIFGTMTDVGLFSNANNLILIAGSIINSLNTVMIPRMTNMYNDGDETEMVKLLEKNIHIQLYFSIAISCGIITINNQMIPWFYGAEFELLSIIVPFVAIGLPFQILQTAVASQYLIPKKDLKSYNGTVIIGGIINLLITLSTVSFIGVYGAIIGYLVSYVVLCLMRSRVLVNSTDFKFRWEVIIGSVISGILMILIVTLITHQLTSSLSTTLIQIILGVFVFLAISTILKINQSLFSEELSVLGRRLKK